MKKQKNNKKVAILNHIKNNAKEYTVLVLVLFIGIILGVMFINKTSDEQKQEIMSYITNFKEALKGNKVIDKSGLLINSLSQNIGLAICMWFLGSTVTLIPIVYAIVLFRGFCLGYTISSLIGVLGIWQGISFSLSALLLQNIVAIPALLALAMSGIRLYKSIIKEGRKENIKLDILRSYCIFWHYDSAFNYLIIYRNIYIFKYCFCCDKIYIIF